MSQQRILELRSILDRLAYEYYVLDQPSKSDQEYDRYYQELVALEDEFPQYRDPNSITQRVGGVVLDAFTKVEHKRTMLSLGNAFNLEDLHAFDERVREVVPNARYVVELKIDGLAMSLIYRDGRFVQALTRGDGVVVRMLRTMSKQSHPFRCISRYRVRWKCAERCICPMPAFRC